jgi:hypothetical protein
MSASGSSGASMGSDVDLKDTLLDLVVQYGLPAVLRALSSVMGRIGGVTGGIVNEAAGVEDWLATPPPPAA